jgi:hypothetical protein
MSLTEKIKKVSLIIAIPALMAGCGGNLSASFGGMGFRYNQKKECHYHCNEKQCHPHDGWHTHHDTCNNYRQRRSW